MTSLYLPDDCINHILNYLQNYRSTLFNCLLVDRSWCRKIVPLLYANPFKGFDLKNKNHTSIILTLILCFNKTEILQLKNQLKLKLIKIKNKINERIDKKINNEYKPLFEYPKYLKNLDYPTMNSMIFQFFKIHYGIHSKLYENFIPMFYQSILRQCNNNIEHLNISLYYDYDYRAIPSNLRNLNSLILHLSMSYNENMQEFLSNLENNCLNLKKLEISLASSNTIKEKLCTIVQKQNNLKAIKFSYLDFSSFLNSIFLSLEFQKYSLVYVDFTDISFSNITFKDFISLYNLKYLRFSSCERVSLDQCEMLNLVSFKLKVLIFNNNNWGENITPLIIKYLGASLRELILIEPIKILMIENISKCCSNLITLEIDINSRTDLLVFPYFNNLKIRVLNIGHFLSIGLDEVFVNLANNLPINVKEVSIHISRTEFYGHILLFEKFLENCHDCLETINLNYSIQPELLKLILNYIKRNSGNLKVLGVTKSEKNLKKKESKLLNQIKANGVKIIDFNSIYEIDNDDNFYF